MTIGVHSGTFNDLRVIRQGLFFDEFGVTKLFGGELIDMSYWHATHGLANELDFISFDVFHDHDPFLGEEMEGQVTHCVSQDTLLY